MGKTDDRGGVTMYEINRKGQSQALEDTANSIGKFMQQKVEELQEKLSVAEGQRDEALEKLAAMESHEPVYLMRNNGDTYWAEVNKETYEDYIAAEGKDELPFDTLILYRNPVPADKPAVAAPDSSELIALLGVMCGWFETLAAKAGWTPQNSGSAFYGYQKAKEAMLAAAPSQSQQSAVDLLREIFEQYEDGPDCYEDPDEMCGYIGKAIRLDDDTFKSCVELINSHDRCPSHESEQGGAV